MINPIKSFINSFKTPEILQNTVSSEPFHKLTASSRHNFATAGNTKRSGGESSQGLARYENHLILDHWALRQNTRVTLHDSLQARTILRRSNDTVIGNGLKPDPSPKFSTLGITREESERWAEDVKDRFDLWAKSKNSDLTGRNNFYQNQGFYQWQYERDGDVFVRLTYSDEPNLTNPLQISFIDPNQIRGDEFTFSSGPSAQNDGIIKDEHGKEIGYRIWVVDSSRLGHFKFIDIDTIDKKTGRHLIAHGFKPEWAGQSRGMPEIGHALQDFEDITTFDGATIKKAINGASLSFTVENDQQTPSDMGMSNINAGGGAGLTVTNEPSSSSPTPQNVGIDGVRHCALDEATITEPGTVNVFGAQQGDKLKAIPSMSPAENTGEYIDGKTKYLSSSVSMPFSIAVMSFPKSHSASRGELGMYADVIEIKKDDIASDFLDIIYISWLSEEIAAGRIQAPGFSDPLLRQAWSVINWIGKPLPDVDPLKTLQAKEKAIELCLTDFDREAVLHNGTSGKANRAKVTKQLEELPTDPFGNKETELQFGENIDEDETDE